jgi:hypothetical protein
MKRLIFAGMLVLIGTAAPAQDTGQNPNSHAQQAYTTLGPAGAGVYRSGMPRDNYSTAANVKPHAGAVGTRNPRYR